MIPKIQMSMLPKNIRLFKVIIIYILSTILNNYFYFWNVKIVMYGILRLFHQYVMFEIYLKFLVNLIIKIHFDTGWSFPQNSANQPVQMIRVSAGVLFHTFTNLHHYTEYLFEVQACQVSHFNYLKFVSKIGFQDPIDNEPLKMENNFYSGNKRHVLNNVCSLKSSVSTHTFPKGNYLFLQIIFDLLSGALGCQL